MEKFAVHRLVKIRHNRQQFLVYIKFMCLARIAPKLILLYSDQAILIPSKKWLKSGLLLNRVSIFTFPCLVGGWGGVGHWRCYFTWNFVEFFRTVYLFGTFKDVYKNFKWMTFVNFGDFLVTFMDLLRFNKSLLWTHVDFPLKDL